MNKSELYRYFSEKFSVKRDFAREWFEELANLAYEQAKDGFVIPGIGKLTLRDKKARMGRNPATGEKIKIAAKTVLKFRVAKAAKDAILGAAAAKKKSSKNKKK